MTASTVSQERRRRQQRQAVSWAVLAVLVVTALMLGSFGDRGPRQPGERARALAEEIACPQCAGESVAQSSAPAAVNIYREIERQVTAGQSDEAIRTYLAQQFGEDILLRPSADGPGAFVWAVPVAVAVIAAAALAMTFRRWQRAETLTPSEEDRALVDAYLTAGPDLTDGTEPTSGAGPGAAAAEAEDPEQGSGR